MNNDIEKGPNPTPVNTCNQGPDGCFAMRAPSEKEQLLEYQCLLAGENQEVQAWERIAHERLVQIIELTQQLGQKTDDEHKTLTEVVGFFKGLGIKEEPIYVGDSTLGLVRAIFEAAQDMKSRLIYLSSHLAAMSDKSRWHASGNYFNGMPPEPIGSFREALEHLTQITNLSRRGGFFVFDPNYDKKPVRQSVE